VEADQDRDDYAANHYVAREKQAGGDNDPHREDDLRHDGFDAQQRFLFFQGFSSVCPNERDKPRGWVRGKVARVRSIRSD